MSTGIEIGKQVFSRILARRKAILKADKPMPLFVALCRSNHECLCNALGEYVGERVLGFDIFHTEDLSEDFYNTYLGCLTMRIGGGHVSS